MTKPHATTDVARRPDLRGTRRRTALLAATAATLGVLLAASTAGGQDVGTGPAAPQGPTPGQPYPNGAPGQPYPANAAGTEGIPTMVPATGGPGPTNPATNADSGASMATAPSVTPSGPPALPAEGGPATQPAPAGGEFPLRLDAGRSIVLHCPRPAMTVTLGSPDVASFAFLQRRYKDKVIDDMSSIVVTGRKGGTTSMMVLDAQGRSVVYDVTVDPDFTALRRQLKEAFPGVAVQATPLNDTIALRGLVPSDRVAAQVAEMASTFAKVHNFMEVAGGQQVMLQIRFAEVDKSAVRDLGVNFGGTDGITAFGNNIGQVNPLGFIQATTTSLGLGVPSPSGAVQLFGSGAFGRTSFAYFIQALEENGLVRMLAEPNVVAINGQEASFIAGGEFPVPVSQGGGSGGGAAVTVQYQEYGIRLNFTPLVLGNGQIRLKVAPEVSELDFANAVRSNGFLIPALTKRKASTTVELGDGQSFALAGLMNDTMSATTDAVPLLGDIPVVGMLFRSTKYQRQQTELVILVTPRLVGPTDPDTTAALPGEHWRFPTDAGAYFKWDLGGNQLEPSKDGHKGADKSVEATVPPRTFHGTYGFTPDGAGSVIVGGH